MSPGSRYEIVIYWSDEDGSFIAELPDLPGCVADGPAHRDGLDEVLARLLELNRKRALAGR